MVDKQDLLNLSGKGLLIHHWDTDGICSARLMLEFLKEKSVVNKTPVLGNYFLTEDELCEYSSYDYVIVVDMGLPEEQILRLAEKAQVFIFDHHLQKLISGVNHYNPISMGKNPDVFPSASWIVNSFLGYPVNLWGVLGIVGDHEHKIKKNNVMYTVIEQYCSENNLTFDDLLRMVYLIDSSYKIGDKKTVEKAPHLLIDYTTGDMILNNSEWKKNLVLLETEIARFCEESGELNGDILIKRINTSYNIISTITRKVAWNTEKNTVIINSGFFPDMDQIYVRSNKNMRPLIDEGKALGLKTGGKAEVLGAVLPKEKTEWFLKKIITFLTDTNHEVEQ